jgi:glycosyltransferase involved in cell wall biosynthesis
MRVLHVINSLPLAGAEILLRDLVPHLRRRDVESSVAVLKWLDSPLERGLQDEGVPFPPTPGYGIYSSRHVARLARLIGGYDLVHAHLFPAQMWVALAAKIAKAPPLVTSEQSTSNRRRRTWLRPADAWMFSRYAAVVCPSHGVADSLTQWVPRVANKVRIVPNGVDLGRFRDARALSKEELGVPPDAAIAIFVARFDAAKDHATLVQAVAKIPRTHLLLVGDGPLRGRCEQLVTSLHLHDRVHFLGWRTDVASLLKSADVYVHSSHFEGFGIAALEAMAGGLPVIASDVPGLAELVGGAGVLVPSGDSEAFAREISAVTCSPELARSIAERCRQRALGLGIEGTADAFAQMYRAVLGSNLSSASSSRAPAGIAK